MSQYIIVFVFFLIALGLMLLSLQFSKYKQRSENCCGGGSCSGESSHDPDHKCSKSEEIENKFMIDVDKLKV